MNGRWHTMGRPVIYTSEASALAILETLVHLEWEQVPRSYQILRIEVPDDIGIEAHPATLPPSNMQDSMAWGDAWLASARSALVSVPSAIAPLSRNVLINPLHPHALRINVADHSRWPWDKRLFQP